MNKIPPLYPYQQKLEDNVLREWKSGKKRLFVQRIKFEYVDELDEIDRGGLGSTGV